MSGKVFHRIVVTGTEDRCVYLSDGFVDEGLNSAIGERGKLARGQSLDVANTDRQDDTF